MSQTRARGGLDADVSKGNTAMGAARRTGPGRALAPLPALAALACAALTGCGTTATAKDAGTAMPRRLGHQLRADLHRATASWPRSLSMQPAARRWRAWARCLA